MNNKSIEISVVLPIYNEEQNISELHRRLTNVLHGMKQPYELLFVDDGSSDQSYKELSDCHQSDPTHTRVLKFSRNFGHHISLLAGLEHARGQYIVLMDSDLQDRPEHIPALYKEILTGFDCVLALRKESKHGLLKRFTSWAYYSVFALMSGVKLPRSISVFRIVNRKFAQSFLQFREAHVFVVALMSWIGFKQKGIYLEHDARFSGETKYSLMKMIPLAMNGLAGFSFRPLQVATLLGLIAISIACAAIPAILFWAEHISLGLGWAITMATLFFFGGVQLIAIGVLGEYVGRTHMEAKRRPLYCVDEELRDRESSNVTHNNAIPMTGRR